MNLLPLIVAVPLVVVLTGCGAPDASPGPTAAVTGGVDAGTAAANVEAERLAVALESYYRTAGYPRDLAGAVDSLAGAGLAPADGSTVAGYAYDAGQVEFRLCVQTPSGAWATYDTAPMALRRGGPSGGCPDDV